MKKKILELSRTYAAILIAATYIAFTYVATFAPSRVEVVVDGKKKIVVTKNVVVRDILRENRISVGSRDIVYPDLGSTVAENDSRIIIKKARRILILYRGFKDLVYAHSSDASLELVKAGYSPKSSFMAYAPKKLLSSNVIRLERIKSIKEERIIYFDSNGNPISASNREALKYAGVRKQVVLKRYAGDTLLATLIVENNVVRKPIEKRVESIARTTRRPSRGDTKRENILTGKVLSMVATAYAPGAGAGAITATGRRAGYGIVAVDPRVIPLGTKLYIPGYGYAVAADTGGSIKGNKIDLCFNTASEAIRWGRRRVKVYILK